jgi:hypothetical protein
MANVSRPLIALLVGTIAFFALWIVALRPSTSSNGTKGGSSAYQSAVAKARQAVTVSNHASVAHGGSVASTPSTAVTNSASSKSAGVTPSSIPPKATTTGPQSVAGTRHRLNVVTRALDQRRVVALLFYNPVATDDRAVKKELAAVSTHGRRVVKLAVPIAELARYPLVTQKVTVNESPTLVLVDAQHQATTIVGFTDRFEIAQRIDDALAVH